ncbi:MAG TPA: carboxyl-terminal protease [Lentisphaeria bacterium]|nr:carboxyl-terminal protease [Lentisphaeria bacterium]
MNGKQKFVAGVLVTVLVLNLVIGFRVYCAIARETDEEEGLQRLRQFVTVMRLIQKHYVDKTDVAYEKLVYGAMNGMVGSLDRFSSFIPPADYTDMREETEGEFGGIGVFISIRNDRPTVIAPMPDSPGMKAGLQAKDQIVEVDGVLTTDLPLPDAIRMIKGEPGTSVSLTVYRPGTNQTFKVDVVRAIIEIQTIRRSEVLPGQIGYLLITQFNENTADEFRETLTQMRHDGIRGLIVDLRFNPGGLLTSAIDVSSMFVEHRKLIVFTEGNKRTKKQEYNSLPGEKFSDLPCVLLINEGSASAAEIVAGCLQDYNHAVVIGEKSFGKGSVQSIIELDDGSALRLTTSKYYTPGRRVIHGNGIEPDIIVDISDEDAGQVHRQLLRPDGAEPEPDEPESIEDLQLDQGVEIVLDLIRRTGGEVTSSARPTSASVQSATQAMREELAVATDAGNAADGDDPAPVTP